MQANQYIGQFLETLDNIDKNGGKVAGLIMSSPGFGKTSTIRKWCEYKDYNLTTLIPSHFSVDDLLGLQTKNGDELVRLAPTWYKDLTDKAKNGKRNVLFIDELSATMEFLQPPLFNLIFDHSFDDKRLPENTFIVSAGNYAEELNNSFKLTAPLVNRFLLLNVKPEDFDIDELLNDDDIESITDKKDIEAFLGLTKATKHKYNFDSFKNWVKDNKSEFQWGKAQYTDDIELGGLLGFNSMRSFKYAMTFAQAYMVNFDSSIWMRIFGDTLGLSVKREGQPIRMVLEACSGAFSGGKTGGNTLIDVCNEILADGLDRDTIKRLEACVNNANINNVTSKDLQRFGEVCKQYPQNQEIQYLLQKLTSRMDRY